MCRDRRDVNHGLVVVGSGFVVSHAVAVLVELRETSLDHPNAGSDVETGGAGDAFDDLHRQGESVFRPDGQPSRISAVGPDQPDGGEPAAQCGQESVRGVAVLDRGSGDDDGEQQSVHIHGNVSLDAVRSLAAIPAAARSGHVDALRDRLRVRDGRARCPTAAIIDSQTVPAADTDALPRAAVGPAGEDRVHRPGWRELHRQLPPRDTTADDEQDGVQTAAMLRVCRLGLPRCRARATAVRGSPTLRR